MGSLLIDFVLNLVTGFQTCYALLEAPASRSVQSGNRKQKGELSFPFTEELSRDIQRP